jgi:two-component system, response regulator PdtaR
MTTRGSVLVVEDEALIAMSLSDALREMGLSVCATADTARDAITLAGEHRPSVVLMDIRLRGGDDGVDAAREIRHRHGIPILFLTGSCEAEVLDRTKGLGPVLIKPVLPLQLQAAVDAVLRA